MLLLIFELTHSSLSVFMPPFLAFLRFSFMSWLFQTLAFLYWSYGSTHSTSMKLYSPSRASGKTEDSDFSSRVKKGFLLLLFYKWVPIIGAILDCFFSSSSLNFFICLIILFLFLAFSSRKYLMPISFTLNFTRPNLIISCFLSL